MFDELTEGDEQYPYPVSYFGSVEHNACYGMCLTI